MRTAITLYERDFYAWTQEQAELIKIKAFDKLDTVNLFEEVESMGKHEKREINSRLEVLLMHLLKWKYQPDMQSKSWKRTIMEQRFSIQDILDDNPSLKPQLIEFLTKAYNHDTLLAHEETGVYLKNFPKSCEWTIQQILDDEFFPS